MNTLPVPYISQRDEGRPVNDCGPAAALMVARAYGKALSTSIDDLYRQYGWPDSGLAVSTIASLLDALGIPVVLSRGGGGLNKLRAFVEAGFPPVLLVDWYGGHFVVATAWVEGGFLVHDPYWYGDGGKNIYVPADDMEAIWGPHDQYNYTAIVPKTPLALGDDMTIDNDAVLVEVNKARVALDAAAALLSPDGPAPEPEPPTPAGEPLEVYNAVGGLRVRDQPNGRIVGGLSNGTRVTGLERRTGWVRHDHGGWSSERFLRPKA